MAKRQGESNITDAILAYANLRADLVLFKVRGGVIQGKHGAWIRTGPKGIPDLLGWYRGQFVGIECKRPRQKKDKKERRSPDQLEWARKIERGGCIYILAESVEDVHKFLVARNCPGFGAGR